MEDDRANLSMINDIAFRGANKDVVLAAVDHDGYNLQYASDDLRGDIYGDVIPIHELP